MVATTTGRATDFITFSRPGATGGGATVTDRDGKIKWAGHNLLTNSESFDAAAWSKAANVTITANAGAAPNGTTTADRAATSGASASIVQSFTCAAGEKYKIAVWAKSFGGTSQTIRLLVDTNILSSDLTVTSTWQLFELEATIVTGGPRSFGITAGSAFANYDVLLWGAHLYRSDLGSMVLNPARGDAYYPTTPRNLLGFTEDFSNAAWNRSGTNVTSNTLLAPNGLQTADLISNTTSASAHGVYQTISFSAACTMSIYAKAGTSNFVGLTNTSSTTPAAYSGAVFNLAAGTVTLSNNCTATITSVGNGWYRCAIAALTVAGSFFVVSVAENGTNAPWNGYTGGDQSIYLWGAQLSDSASLDAYSPVYGAAVTSAAYYAPRLDFDANGSALGLLVEEQRTNILLRSQEFNTTWIAGFANTTGTPPWINAGIAPDGTATADALIPDTTNNAHYFQQAQAKTTGNYTYSVYAKASGYSFVAIQVRDLAGVFKNAQFNISTGVVVSSSGAVSTSIQSVGNGWYRCVFTYDNATGANSPNDAIFVGSVANNWNTGFVGDGTSGVLLWGAQLEAGSFATSYIPTGASTATRTADVASVSTQAFPYSASASSLVVSATALANQYSNVLELSASASAFGLLVYHNLGSISAYVDASSVSLGSATAGTVQKIGIAYDGSANGAVRNGGTVSSVGTTVSAAANKLGIGSSFSGGSTFNGHIRQITYIPRRLSNSELQARTV